MFGFFICVTSLHADFDLKVLNVKELVKIEF